MAFTPISNTVPQYEENGVAASGYFIKFYESGTTTPTAMATDSTGTTLLDKCELNTEGYPINGSSAVFIPHIDKKYKIALFRNAADADANDLSSAAWPAVDGLEPVVTVKTTFVEGIDSVADIEGFVGVIDDQQTSLKGWHPDSDVGGGALYWNAAKPKSEHNGGTVFSPTVPFSSNTGDYLGGVGETDSGGSGCWVRGNMNEANILAFGGDNSGLKATDNLPSLMKVVQYVLTTTKFTANPASLGGGYASIYFPQGVYRFSDGTALNGLTGVEIKGDGRKASTLILDGVGKTLFPMNTYSDIHIKDLTICAGLLTDSGGLPYYTVEDEGSRTNTLFDFESTSGGTDFTISDCFLIGFKTVLKSTQSNVNGDGHVYNRVYFRHNDTVWDNLNPQAVIWTFNQCKYYFNLDLFKNNAETLVINGGDSINRGIIHLATGVTGLGGGAEYNNLRMENFQNIDPSSNPRLIQTANGSYSKVVFNSFRNTGGGTYATKILADLRGGFDVEFNNSSIQGIAAVEANNSDAGILSNLSFSGCSGFLDVQQTLSGAQGNRPINLKYIQSSSPIAAGRALIDRQFRGSLAQRSPTSSTINTDAIYFESIVSSNTIQYEVPVFCADKYGLVLTSIDMLYTKNGGADYTLTLWNDTAKTTKIYEATISDGTNVRAAKHVIASDMLAFPIFTSSSGNMLIEVTSVGNSGNVISNINLGYIQS